MGERNDLYIALLLRPLGKLPLGSRGRSRVMTRVIDLMEIRVVDLCDDTSFIEG
jgi:hypothetical protein